MSSSEEQEQLQQQQQNQQLTEQQEQEERQSQVDKDKDLQSKGQGYKYWQDPSKYNPEYKPKQPKKIDPTQIEQKQHKASAWNTSGTWEEKKVDVQIARPFLERAFGFEISQQQQQQQQQQNQEKEGEDQENEDQSKKQLQQQQQQNEQLQSLLQQEKKESFKTKNELIQFYGLESISGSISMIYKKFKWFPGYDLNMDLQYRGIGELEGAQGVLKFKEFQDDGDYDFSIEHEGDQFKNEAIKEINASLGEIQKTVKAAIDYLAQH
ncbi:hypothetical protein PPERSA_11089 [Pseudocohnilembus persalinus]|uniref:Activator of Hsp90 ATPase AHSA1-like N-terminal domain-containing protein n=1 Tax=Pseudocohnilembus persalinus TaxID=266149 RepID=A0A0V0QZ85_PSEPJ|nr:hypothetical protein PPERSA_11089 [Pseudocohnilembus persalinus]|eukprot:KRX07540.1 hypothetical protein PPERSA_11089 [Pseudocohnilembus persalinus]